MPDKWQSRGAKRLGFVIPERKGQRVRSGRSALPAADLELKSKQEAERLARRWAGNLRQPPGRFQISSATWFPIRLQGLPSPSPPRPAVPQPFSEQQCGRRRNSMPVRASALFPALGESRAAQA